MADNMYSTENVPIRCIMTDGVVKDTKLFEQKVIRITYKIHILHFYMGLRIISKETTRFDISNRILNIELSIIDIIKSMIDQPILL